MEPEISARETAADNFDSLLELEHRIEGIVERFSEARRLQQAAEQNAARLERLLSEQEHRIARLNGELDELRSERQRVRERIETLLGRIESL